MSPGLRSMLISVLGFSAMGALVKLAGKTVPLEHLVAARVVVTLVLSYAWLKAARVPVLGTHKWALAARGLLGFCALYCFYGAVTRLSFADATVIHYTNPLITTVMAGVWLKEQLDRRTQLALGLGFVGVLLIARPGWLFGGHLALDATGLALAVASAVLSAAAYTLIRSMKGREHPLVLVFYFPLVSLPFALPLAATVPRLPSPYEWLLLLGLGCATQVGQVFMTRGLLLEPAGRATMVSFLQVPLSFVWGVLLFGEPLNPWSVAGAVTVGVALWAMVRR